MTDLFESSNRTSPASSQDVEEFILEAQRQNTYGIDSNVIQKRRDESKALDEFLSFTTPGIESKPDTPQNSVPPETVRNQPDATVPDTTQTPVPQLGKTGEVQEMADGFIIPKSETLTASSMHQYLNENFDIFDKNRDGRINYDEITIDGTFDNKSVEKYNKFASSNYYALRDMTNDDDFREQGISRADISTLKGVRKDRSADDLASSLADAFWDEKKYAIGGIAVGLFKTFKGNWKAGLTVGALGIGASAIRGSGDLIKQSWKNDSLFEAEDPNALWKRLSQ